MKTLAEIKQQLLLQPLPPLDNELIVNGKSIYRSEYYDYSNWNPSDYDYYQAYFESRCRYAVVIEDYDLNHARKYFKTLQSAKEFILLQKLAGHSDHISLFDLKTAEYSDWYFLQMETYPFKGEIRESIFPEL